MAIFLSHSSLRILAQHSLTRLAKRSEKIPVSFSLPQTHTHDGIFPEGDSTVLANVTEEEESKDLQRQECSTELPAR